MISLFFYIFINLLAFPQDNADLIVNLEDEVMPHSERTFYTDIQSVLPLPSDTSQTFTRFDVDQSIIRCLNGYKFFKDKDSYTKHTPIHIDVFNYDNIVISYDDNEDGVFDDRPAIHTKMGARNQSKLLFKHKSDSEKDLLIECDFQIRSKSALDYSLTVFYSIRSKGVIRYNNKDYDISIWKSLAGLGIVIDGQRVVRNNPIKIGKSFYQISDYDPVANTLTLSWIDPSEKMYGTVKNLYINETELDEAFLFHNIDLEEVKKKDYHLFYFWGHWCHPCMSKMEATSQMLNNVNDNIGVYNISLLSENRDGDTETVKDIVRNYNLPNHSLIEEVDMDRKLLPMIRVFGNESYPNFIVIDSEYKILFVSSREQQSIESFLEGLD
jgi:thiol-disulfide isomerase/thioredoxin